MAKKIYETPMLDELEKGPWPSFISGIKNYVMTTLMSASRT